MKLTYRARETARREPVVVGRDGIARSADEPLDVPADWRTPGWRPRAEAHLIELEDRHRAAQDRARGCRVRIVELDGRIQKGRAYVERDPSWRGLLDRIELERAALNTALVAAERERDALADEYVRKLHGYEKLICAEEGRPWE